MIVVSAFSDINRFGPGSGTLGFIFNSYARESDGLPFAGTIILSKAYFNNSVATGDAGKFALFYFHLYHLLENYYANKSD
jgi:hypothetical protein